MIIQCEKCRTKFNIDDNILRNEGSKVKCSRCKHIFLAYPSEHLEFEDHQTVIVNEEELGPLEGTTFPETEEGTDFDEIFEEDSMEDIEELAAKYGEGSLGLTGETDMEESSIEGIEEKAEEDFIGETLMNEDATEKKKPRNLKLLFIFIAILIIIVGAAYGITRWAPDLVHDFLTMYIKKPAEKQSSADMGASRLEILTVNGSFVDSTKAGRLFVIRGKVRNGYPDIRSFILLRGSLLNDEGQVVKEKTSYAGNVFEEDDLLTLPLEKIEMGMRNRQGFDNKNLDTEPGTTIDFCIVFDSLPENLSEFTVGAVSSSPASP